MLNFSVPKTILTLEKLNVLPFLVFSDTSGKEQFYVF